MAEKTLLVAPGDHPLTSPPIRLENPSYPPYGTLIGRKSVKKEEYAIRTKTELILSAYPGDAEVVEVAATSGAGGGR